MPRRKTEHVVVITGAAHGVGKRLALGFALRSDTMRSALMLSAHPDESLDVLRRDCEALHALTHAWQPAATDPWDASGVGEAALSTFGRIDLWINNAPVRAVSVQRATHGSSGSVDVHASVLERGADAALACFRSQGFGALINVDPLSSGARADGSVEFGDARSAMRTALRALERRAAGVPHVRVATVSPRNRPIDVDAIADATLRAAFAQRGQGTVSAARSALARGQLMMWNALVMPRAASTSARSRSRSVGVQPSLWRLTRS